MFTDYYHSPLGWIEFKASDCGICQLIFCGRDKGSSKPNQITDLCKQQLEQYFTKQCRTFEVPLDAQGTDFQREVWRCLAQIPYGETATYLDIAKRVNRPKGSQAVGGANGRNPISIIVPCHRVIGSNGALTGYAGGIERKLWLLEHEGIATGDQQKVAHRAIDSVIGLRQSKTQFLS